tara:strand:- start:206 stop:379 length:174 start_codon:yes stop_codon:yes gene_type:complete
MFKKLYKKIKDFFFPQPEVLIVKKEPKVPPKKAKKAPAKKATTKKATAKKTTKKKIV